MPLPTTLNTQNLIPDLPPVSVVTLDYRSCDVIQDVLNVEAGPKLLGVSLRLSKRGAVQAVVLATPTTAYLIVLGKNASSSRKGSPSCGASLSRILENPHCLLAGVSIARLALLLYQQTGAHVRGLELLMLPAQKTGRHVTVADLADTYISSQAKKRHIYALWLHESNVDLCLKAWLLASVAEKCANLLEKYIKVDTRNLRRHQLSCLSKLVLNVETLDADKPTSVDNDFDQIEITPEGQIELHNSRYKSRVRPSAQTTIEINGGSVKAQAVSARGKSTGLKLFKGKLPDDVAKVRVVGREEATNAERRRDDFVLRVLQGSAVLDASPFVQMLWFHKSGKSAKKSGMNQMSAPAAFEQLNTSQRRVALAMISQDEALVIAQGPPGTGKTSTIGAALKHWEAHGESAWVIAHSNVGVHNIAESLYNRKVDFKIIVSKEFHFEWHEHLYREIERHLIRSDDFGHGFDARNCIADTKVILCTLSMLSNPVLYHSGVFRHVPVVRLVVDEASQIDTFEFMHLFDMFAKPMAKTCENVLAKVCMFGDPKQLPPFGSDVAPNMKTIFDFKQFDAYFLDTQYRMPVPLESTCIKFVDVRKGKEQRVGRSWKNTEEVNTIVNIVKKYYQQREVRIITPYDAQRAAISATLKSAGVDRFDQVYNVDSFQGHEAPCIIVSAVRTSSAGFLKSLNRMNVMLTRCKAGMVLVTQRAFLQKHGQQTLLGKLAGHWEKQVGVNVAWVDAMAVADGKAKLPRIPEKSTITSLGKSVG